MLNAVTVRLVFLALVLLHMNVETPSTTKLSRSPYYALAPILPYHTSRCANKKTRAIVYCCSTLAMFRAAMRF